MTAGEQTMPDASDKVLIVCEGATDQRFLEVVLQKSGRRDSVEIQNEKRPLAPQVLIPTIPGYGNSKNRVDTLSRLKAQRDHFRAILIVFDMEFGSAIEPAPEMAQIEKLWLVPAVPTIEAWLLCDPAVHELVYQSRPEEIEASHSDFLTNRNFKFYNTKFLRKLTTNLIRDLYEPQRAIAFSPSLRAFFRSLDKAFGREKEDFVVELPSALLANLVLEMYPRNAPLYKTLAGDAFTGAEMAEQILAKTDLGRQYTSDLLRVCRDILARQATKIKT